MYYSYYFDIEKEHRINFGFKALTTSEEHDGTITSQFDIYIQEVVNGEIKQEERQTSQFVFNGSKRNDEDDSDYDVDLLRERIASSSKFVFRVLNNRDTSQNVIIGLITSTASMNPLGCEIIYESEPYKAELKAGNLSRLEAQYVEPIIRQTVISFNFNEGGLPDELSLPDGGEYVNGYRLYRASRMAALMEQKIKGSNKFAFEMNVAPESFDVAVEPTIFEVVLNGIGTFALNKTNIQFLQDGGNVSSIVSAPLVNPLTAESFFNSGLRQPSLLRIEGDGKGKLKATYAGVEVNSTYNAENDFIGVSVEGKAKKDSASRVILKLDNIIAYYEK